MTHPPILGFFGPFRFLSNYHFVNVVLDGETYRTTEHAYQAAKTLSPSEREMIRDMAQPKDAKKAGYVIEMRPDWNELRVEVMYNLNKQKYAEEPLRSMLLATGDAYLEETNTWNDTFWGVCNGVGDNMLGQVLMLIRNELKLANR